MRVARDINRGANCRITQCGQSAQEPDRVHTGAERVEVRRVDAFS
jgi:hypothetical protein